MLDQHGYMAGSDADRLDDLNRAIRDPRVRAIVATRGGAGAYRIAGGLDVEALRRDPKPIVGFSDITYLHLAALKEANAVGIHGSLVGDTAQQTTRQLLMGSSPVVIERDPSALSASIGAPGSAQGPLVGGNLAGLATSVGVRVPSLHGCILFLEAQRAVGLGTVDRQLTQLLDSGTLDGIAGIALGSFQGFDGYEDRGWQLSHVLADRLLSLDVPVLGGLPCGHDLADQAALPLGTHARLHAGSGTLLVTAPAYD